MWVQVSSHGEKNLVVTSSYNSTYGHFFDTFDVMSEISPIFLNLFNPSNKRRSSDV